jgi:OmpA-OmpF porin, OOP family
MIRIRPAILPVAALCASLAAGCQPKQKPVVVPAPPPPAPVAPGDQIALVPDPETGVVGRAIVSTAAGTVTLGAARDSTTVRAGAAPAPVTTLSEDDVRRVFGDVLSTLPAPPQHFTLYFKFESDDLTDESRALVSQVLQAVRTRPAPDVMVIGHTDTTGAARTNYELGLKRANMVCALLLTAGLESSVIEVVSHGEADLLVKTADNVNEPRNRRVEITVR